MKDTAHLKAKFEWDSGTRMAAKGKPSCSRALVLLGAEEQRDQWVNNWLEENIPAGRRFIEQNRVGKQNHLDDKMNQGSLVMVSFSSSFSS